MHMLYYLTIWLFILIDSKSTSNFLCLRVSRSTALILKRLRVSVRKGIRLKSDVQIRDVQKCTSSALCGCPPLSYRQLIGKNRRKTLTHISTIKHWKIPVTNFHTLQYPCKSFKCFLNERKFAQLFLDWVDFRSIQTACKNAWGSHE